MRLKIHLYGDEILRRKAAEIDAINPELSALVENMFETMYYHEGLGLAAPQVGIPLSLVVIDVPREGTGRLVLINPVICESGNTLVMEEGCLSFPEIIVPVERASEVTVEFTSLAGKRKKKSVTGIAAQAVQHELDHLDGVLLVDRMSTARRAVLSGKLRKLRARAEKGEYR